MPPPYRDNGVPISYSQQREDVLLARAFGGQESGFFIDVGANHPRNGSITQLFVDKGWTGINIDPHPSFFAEFEKDRPNDINLALAISDVEGEMELYVVADNPALTTTEPTFGKRYAAEGRQVESRTVRCMTLAEVCRTHVLDRNIDFMSIDVEGAEEKVLRGADFSHWRPRVLVVEAVRPNSSEQTHDRWESIIIGQNYRYVFFDGVNRFYVDSTEDVLCRRLSYPVCSLDRYLSVEQLELIEYRKLGRAARSAARMVQAIVNFIPRPTK
jgi:FkbM family methyltransferase